MKMETEILTVAELERLKARILELEQEVEILKMVQEKPETVTLTGVHEWRL